MNLEYLIGVFLSQYIATTRTSYTRPLQDMSRYIGPERPLDKIKSIDLLEYIGEVKARNYAPATVNKYVKTIKVFFNWCVRMEFVMISPAANLPTVRVAQRINRNKAMQQDEFDLIIDYLKNRVKYPMGWYRWRDYAAFLFLADTGCRRGGLSSLTIDRLDIATNSAIVVEKGDKYRDVYFGDECSHAIINWLTEKKEKGKYSKWVFSGSDKPWAPAAVSQMVRRTAKAAGVKATRSAHSLRHKKGHDMAADYVNPKITQAALGHSNVETTVRHYYDTDKQEVADEVRKHAYRPASKRELYIFDDDRKKQSM